MRSRSTRSAEPISAFTLSNDHRSARALGNAPSGWVTASIGKNSVAELTATSLLASPRPTIASATHNAYNVCMKTINRNVLTQGSSAQDTTYRWLKQRISEVPKNDGQFITEAEIAETLGVSRTPVREALLRVETEGHLQILPKKGAYIAPISDADALSTMEARAMVESWSARRVLELDRDLSADLEELLKQQEASQNDPVEFIRLDRMFHSAIVDAAENPSISDFYDSLRQKQLRMGLQVIVSDRRRSAKVFEEHRMIVAALASGTADGAVDAVLHHLQSTWATLSNSVHRQLFIRS